MPDKKNKGFWSKLKSVFTGYDSIDEDFYEELEETLIMGDLGVETTMQLLDDLRDEVSSRGVRSTEECRLLMADMLKDMMRLPDDGYRFESGKSVVLILGVNGVGKTTSVGKLASYYRNAGKKVLICAADTYRAAASEQLKEWAQRSDVPMISGQDGADPASVVFDAASSFASRNADILLVDTAGRLHNKKNLMQELHRIYKILEKNCPEAAVEVLIVLDATTGQNAMVQAREFQEAVTDLSGIILTKMDGTAKGGIAIAIQKELGIPVKFIGVGEHTEDLRKFDAEEYVDELLG